MDLNGQKEGDQKEFFKMQCYKTMLKIRDKIANEQVLEKIKEK